MKRIFNEWFKKNYPDCKAEWVSKIFPAFQNHVKEQNFMRPVHAKKHDIEKWMKKLGVIVIDKKHK